VDAVLREIRDYRASVQAIAFQMDRGEYRPASHAPAEGDAASSVVPFPTREER
jgi:flagellar protein FlbD